jgi:hypothetical protein
MGDDWIFRHLPNDLIISILQIEWSRRCRMRRNLINRHLDIKFFRNNPREIVVHPKDRRSGGRAPGWVKEFIWTSRGDGGAGGTGGSPMWWWNQKLEDHEEVKKMKHGFRPKRSALKVDMVVC